MKVVRFKVLMAVKIQVDVFWVVMPYSVVVGYHFRGPQHYTVSHPGRP